MAKTLTKDEVTINQQIEDLRERMRILQNDRAANIDVLEANKSANKDEIKRLRDENKDLRKKLAHLSKTALSDTNEKNEIKLIEREVDRLRKIYDEYKLTSTRHRKELDHLKDAVRDLELNSQRPHMEDNEFTRRIRSLENKLDKAMIKFNESQSIRKTYESILQRLNEERVGFDNQLSAIEKTLQAKQRDYDELLLLSGDANHAREVALHELEGVRAFYEAERKKREKELREKHSTIQMRKAMLDRIKYREKLRNTLNATASSKPPSPEQELKNTMSQKSLLLEKIESKNKVSIFENAFRKIKEATGVSDVNEVIQKIITQESTTENLINVTKENQLKIESLNNLKKKIKAHVEELKYSGIGGGQHRKMVDSYEDQLANGAARLERSRLKYERLNKIIISMKAGIGHLQDKLENFRSEISGKSFIISDDTVADALHECDLCFTMLLKRIKAGEDEIKRIHLTEFTAPNEKEQTGFSRSGTMKPGMLAQPTFELTGELDEAVSNINILRPFNQRIDLNLTDDNNNIYSINNSSILDGNVISGLLGGPGGGSALLEEGGPDLDDDELTRDKVKRASTQILLAMDKKKKKNMKKKGGGGNDGIEEHSHHSKLHHTGSPMKTIPERA